MTRKQTFYTPEEIEHLRAQVREMNRLAKEESERRGGILLHPRIRALREQQLRERFPDSAVDFSGLPDKEFRQLLRANDL